MTLSIQGTGVSSHIAIGYVNLIARGQIPIQHYPIEPKDIKAEQRRYRNAVAKAKKQLMDIGKLVPQNLPADIISFIDAHILMLSDPALLDAPLATIKQTHCNAEWALKQQYNQLLTVFDAIDDPYLKTRKDDITHVVSRIQRLLLKTSSSADIAPSQIDYSQQILVVDDLSPSELVTLHQSGLAGFVSEFGGPLSHTAILARSLGIPALVGTHSSYHLLKPGEQVILDEKRHTLIASPDKHTLQWYRNQQREHRKHQQALAKIKDQVAATSDGHIIELQANIELPEDVNPAKKNGCNGIGLYRTEYLFMNREDLPTEDEQYQAYRSVFRRMKGQPITIRTLDLGADKQVDSGRQDAPLPTNPALGLRAIRLCLQEPLLFHTQIRAILRAGYGHDIRIMIPMISSIEELMQVKTHIANMATDLQQAKIRHNQNIPIGLMVEVPATAIAADRFAKHCDFLSIGTNDLIQYTLAIDRVDDNVSYLYNPLHPAVLQLIKITIDSANKAKIPVSMCGEMAGDSRFTQLLLGMGLRSFSIQPNLLLPIKDIINKTQVTRAQKLARKILRSTNHNVMHDLLDQLNQYKIPDSDNT